MNISALNVRIQIQKTEIVADEVGNRINEWTDSHSCYATVSEESGQEKVADVGVVENETLNFTIRYCKAVEKITATEYRVLFQGDIYNILAVNHANYKKKSLKLKCQRARR